MFVHRTLAVLLALGACLLPWQRLPSTAATLPPSTPACVSAPPTVHGNAWQLVQANNGFGFRLYGRLAPTHPHQNVFTSPLSVALALEMTALGSAGSTSRAMSATLGLGSMPPARLRYLAAALLTGLRSYDPRVELSVANSLWSNTGAPIQPSFVDQAQHSFGAHLTTLPFSDPASLRTINGWVSCATHGKIPTILNQLNPSQVLILINALYFHGEWSSPFYKGETYRATFHAVTASRQVPFMHDTTYLPYLSTGNFQAVSLPFGRGRYSMVVVLPRPATNLSQVEGDLSATSWRGWMANLKGTEVKLSLPRFTIRNGFDLTNTLGTLGMRPALEGGANFSRMCVSGCHISQVIHKTYLQVNEAGTTAAAVTAIVATGGGGGPPPHIEQMNVNRPFLVALRDRVTGSILFFGRIVDPTS
jgi:serine protease inhibitor